MTVAKDFVNGKALEGKAIYIVKPVVMLYTGIVMFAGTAEEVKTIIANVAPYYDECVVEYRRFDLYMNNNKKIEPES